MLFNNEVLHKKIFFLDAVLQTDFTENIVAQYIAEPFSIKLIPRTWEPGGGATLFCIETNDKRYFLKAKHANLLLESRLESEPNFSSQKSLKNEFDILTAINTPWVPKVIFYAEHNNFTFLALEWLEPFEQVVNKMEVGELWQAWNDLTNLVKDLFKRNIVHTDIHELNICFRDDKLVLCDFEEARIVHQNLSFEESLDYCGENLYGNVGFFPSETGKGPPGLTCLLRIRDVFRKLIKNKLPEYLRQCHFDNECPFNLDSLQEQDDRIYQSLNFPDLSVQGQRPERDFRLLLLSYFLSKVSLKDHYVEHLDIGSNLGMFCFKASEHKYVKSSVGIEAFPSFVEAANILKFTYGFEKVNFYEFICGRNTLLELKKNFNFVTMLSVYHHISEKDFFLDDLKRLSPSWLLVEFATQERYYKERGSLGKEVAYVQEKLSYPFVYHLADSPDYQRPLILYTKVEFDKIDKVFLFFLSRRRKKLVHFILPVFNKLHGLYRNIKLNQF